MYGFKEVDAEQLKAWLDQGGVQLIDVRTPAEVARGIIPGARALPLAVLPVSLDQVDKSRPVVFYCLSGARSAQAAAFVANQGLGEAASLRGGINAWMRHGFPVVAPQ